MEAVAWKVDIPGQTASIKIRCGLAIYPEDDGSTSDLIRLYDAAMYILKQHGYFSGVNETAEV